MLCLGKNAPFGVLVDKAEAAENDDVVAQPAWAVERSVMLFGQAQQATQTVDPGRQGRKK